MGLEKGSWKKRDARGGSDVLDLRMINVGKTGCSICQHLQPHAGLISTMIPGFFVKQLPVQSATYGKRRPATHTADQELAAMSRMCVHAFAHSLNNSKQHRNQSIKVKLITCCRLYRPSKQSKQPFALLDFGAGTE